MREEQATFAAWQQGAAVAKALVHMRAGDARGEIEAIKLF